MRTLRSLLLVGSAVVLTTIAAAQPEPEKRRDHRERKVPPPGPASGSAYADDDPTDAPPAAQAEAPAPKPGFVWVAGHHEWRAKKWTWIAGHYERERAGKKWRPGRWEKVGAKFKWFAGGWEDGAPAPAGDYPREAPPAPQQELVQAKPGFVWIPGHWEFKAGKYTWLPGHHERERAGKKWREGRWNKDGDRYTFAVGDWEDATAGGDYPKDAPPPPQAETAAPRAGFVWIPGKWEFKAGKYVWLAGHLERERAGKKWREGRWDKDGDRYKFTEGDWVDTSAPEERPGRRPRPEWKLERPTVASYWPSKGKVGARVIIRGKNLPNDTQVLWAGAPVAAAKVTPDHVIFSVPAGAASGAIALKVGRRELPVGSFEVADIDAEAAAKKAEEDAKKAAEAAIAERMKQYAADAAARRAAVQKEIDERIANRERRREERIAAMQAKWDRAFLADTETRDELVLHSYRIANLARMRELAELNGNRGALVRIELAVKREATRHEDRMVTLKAAFKGGKP